MPSGEDSNGRPDSPPAEDRPALLRQHRRDRPAAPGRAGRRLVPGGGQEAAADLGPGRGGDEEAERAAGANRPPEAPGQCRAGGGPGQGDAGEVTAFGMRTAWLKRSSRPTTTGRGRTRWITRR